MSDLEAVAEPIISALAATLNEYRDEIDGKIADHQQRTRNVISDLDGRVTDAKATAISATRAARATPKPQPSLRSILVKSLTARLVAIKNHGADPLATARQLYGDHRHSEKIMDAIRDVTGFVTRSTTAIATTTDTAWAGALVDTGVFPGAIASLAPSSAYARLAVLGIRVNVGAGKSMLLPYRVKPGSVPNPFVGEGAPLPVRAFSLAGVSLQPKKAGGLCVFTTEMLKHSTPSIETLVSQQLDDDIGLGVDSVMLGKAAGSATVPPGLLNGVSSITVSTGTGAAAAAADITALVAAINPAPVSPVLIMNPVQAINAALILPSGIPLPVITSDVVPAGTVICLDASDFASSADDSPVIDTSEDAALTMDDQPVSADMLATHPVSSLWQHALFAVRVFEFVDFKMRRPGRISYGESVKW